jgi:hypothetical protein
MVLLLQQYHPKLAAHHFLLVQVAFHLDEQLCHLFLAVLHWQELGLLLLLLFQVILEAARKKWRQFLFRHYRQHRQVFKIPILSWQEEQEQHRQKQDFLVFLRSAFMQFLTKPQPFFKDIQVKQEWQTPIRQRIYQLLMHCQAYLFLPSLLNLLNPLSCRMYWMEVPSDGDRIPLAREI